MFAALKKWIQAKTDTKAAVWWLAALSFAESSVFPIAPDIMMIPMILARRERWAFFCLVTTVASVLGGVFGYMVGYFLMETVGAWLVNLYGLQPYYDQFSALVDDWGALAVIVAGVSPIPYKAATVAAGALHMNVAIFVLASVFSRAIRFFAVGAALYYFGPPILRFVENNKVVVTVSSIVTAVVIGLVAVLAFAF